MPARIVCPTFLRTFVATCLAMGGLFGAASTGLAQVPFPGSDDDWLRRTRSTSSSEPRLVIDSYAADTPGTLFLWHDDSEEGGPDLDEPIVTDRPDFTEASVTVGAGVLQIESGYTYITDTEGGVTTSSHSYPEMLLRYGVVANWLELRLAWNYGHGLTEGIANSTNGADDLYLGAKIGLTPQDGWLPEMAIVPQATIPTGHDDFSAGETLPSVNWLYGWDVNDFLATGGSTQFYRAIDNGTGDTYTGWAQSWTVGYSLLDELGAYTEWFAFFPATADTDETQHYFNGGFTFLITDDIQWDIRAGLGLNDAADDHFIGTGLSVRFH